MRQGVGLCLATLCIFSACSPAEGPESVAQSFVERYYVRPDLPGAKALAEGLARAKIEDEEQLVQGTSRADGAAGRKVSYSLYTTRKMGEDRIFVVYDIAISVDSRVMKKRAFISTARMKEGWRVTNFQEEDI
ncbi:MAG: hypothetical protein ACREJ1_07705 [Candidatus Methylomirabilales bacterium]